ncbi:hypothetical protein LCGC14_2556340, partial [marine sediment metagenome]
MARRILYGQQSVSYDPVYGPIALDHPNNWYIVQTLNSGSGATTKDVMHLGHLYDDGDIRLNLRGEAWRSSGSSTAGSVTIAMGDSVSGSFNVQAINSGSADLFDITVDLLSSGYSFNSRQDITVTLGVTPNTIRISGSVEVPITSTIMSNPTISIVGTSSGSVGSGDVYHNANAAGANN